MSDDFMYCPAHDYGDPGYPPNECGACLALNKPDRHERTIRRLKRDRDRLAERVGELEKNNTFNHAQWMQEREWHRREKERTKSAESRADAATNEVEELQDELSELRSPAPRGKEAEELRSGVERLLEEAAACDDAVPQSDLQRLLDEVDARDSLSFLAQQDRPHPEPRAAVPECVEPSPAQSWQGMAAHEQRLVIDELRILAAGKWDFYPSAPRVAADCLEHLATEPRWTMGRRYRSTQARSPAADSECQPIEIVSPSLPPIPR